MPISYHSPKTAIRKSFVHGYGLFAIKPIKKGEIVVIKGGHIFNERILKKVKDKISEAYFQIEDDFVIGPLKKSEVKKNKLYINHSCDPNIGIRGQITLIAMRNIKAGEELTYDWAMEDPGGWKMKCNCGAKNCRKIITGKDWKNPKLQRKYKGYFSAYLQEKIWKNQ